MATRQIYLYARYSSYENIHELYVFGYRVEDPLYIFLEGREIYCELPSEKILTKATVQALREKKQQEHVKAAEIQQELDDKIGNLLCLEAPTQPEEEENLRGAGGML